MEHEIAATRILLSEGIGILALALALIAPVGLCLSAAGTGRYRNRFTNMGWMVLLLPFGFMVLYIFGWMFYFAFASGPGFTGGFQSAWHAVPWGDQLGPGFHQSDSGELSDDNQDFIRLLVLAWLGSTILAGAVLERVKLGGLLLLSALLIGVCTSLALAWGWSANGWMTALMGYHDPLGVTTLATMCGGFALGVLRIVGPRIASVDDQGRAHRIEPHSPGLVLAGQLLFFMGLAGLSVSAIDLATPVMFGGAQEYVSTNVYGAPVDPAGVFINLLAALAGGLMISAVLTQASIDKMAVLIVPGLIGALPAADFFNPLQTFLTAMFITWACSVARPWLERKFALDDVSGAVSLFGFAGFWGLGISGIMLWGIPASANPDFVHINPFGHATAAMVLFWILGFVPGNIAARILRYAGGLRLDRLSELAGRDLDILREAEESASAAYVREDRFVVEHLEKRS